MPRILVVEDEPDVLDSMVSVIRKHGYQVDGAENGVEALRKVRERKPDLVLTDVLMPHMDGYKFYKELKSHKDTAETPVLVVTGRGQMEDSFQVAGVDGFITKPFTTEELFLEIEDIFAINMTRLKLQRNEAGVFRKKIIAISQQKGVIENILEQCRRIGYYIETSGSSSQLVTQVMKSIPDMIFIDLSIADMDSLKLVDIVKRLPQAEAKKIVTFFGLSGSARQPLTPQQAQLGETSLSFGATQFVGRYTQRTFIRTILDVFNHRN